MEEPKLLFRGRRRLWFLKFKTNRKELGWYFKKSWRRSGRKTAASRGCFLANLKSRWMTAVENVKTGYGISYNVYEKSKNGSLLGGVAFYPEWKHWVFYPVEKTIFSDRCLSDLAAFLAELNKEGL